MSELAYGVIPFDPVLMILATAAWLGIAAFVGAPLWLCSALAIAELWLYGTPMPLLAVATLVAVVLNLPMLRAMIISKPIMTVMQKMKIMPVISDTERIALEAGSAWVDGELFSGKPNFARIRAEKYPELSAEEKAFLAGPVEQLCQMTSDWEVFTNHDLPERVWDFIKKERFFGMIIAKEYGGHGFSAICHSEVVQKLTSRSIPLAVTVMVPNSLGPGELISHYGTKHQKDYYLPRLARGEEIPCFALTEPNAGSDAGSITSSGEVFKGQDGKLYIKLNWDKRYITLAAISSLIGLAVKLYDPNELLGKGKDIGITCVLVPASVSGVVLGKRHNPMGVPFYNCPTLGKDVVVSVDQIIGGAEGAGQGWRMLMESLAAGRSISLPAQSLGTSKLATRAASAYSGIREQFGISINKFEGVEERLAHMYGLNYMMEATRKFTAGAVDSGIKPAVVSAIAKCYMTELSRQVIIDGMDVLGGAGISRGPHNLLANAYIGAPIGITVEGANILTRSMIIFGQGAIRCHPYAYREFRAVAANDHREFDSAFFGHVGFVIQNAVRTVVHTLTRGHLASVPSGKMAPYYRKLAWSSSIFALMSDMAMGTLGGKLKFKEALTGRYSDALAWMYIVSATLRRWEAEGSKSEHLPFIHWGMNHAFSEVQKAFEAIFANFDVPVLGWIMKGPIAFFMRLNRLSGLPSDVQGFRMVQAMSKPGAVRDSMTEGIYIPQSGEEALHIYDGAFNATHEAAMAFKKIRAAVVAKQLPKKLGPKVVIKMALDQQIITAEEANIIEQAVFLKNRAVQVDSFKVGEFVTGHMESSLKRHG
jgi:acyl-CoA dehydrogenase